MIGCSEIAIPYVAALIVGLAIWIGGLLGVAWFAQVALGRKSLIVRVGLALPILALWSVGLALGWESVTHVYDCLLRWGYG